VDRFLPVYAELGMVTPLCRRIWRAHGLAAG
jgi:hypothetical protein